jgi:Lon protease-like protein
MKFRLYVEEELVCHTDWLPMVKAAWSRFSRDRDLAQHGGQLVLLKDDRQLANVQARTGQGWPWPDRETQEVDLRDAAAAVQQLARVAGVPAAALAEELTAQGLPTTPARLKSMSTQQDGRRTNVSPAELVTLCYAAIGVLKKAPPLSRGSPSNSSV